MFISKQCNLFGVFFFYLGFFSQSIERYLSFRWFYEGRNGWWEYDERTAQELEHHHKKGDKNCELLIAGFLYSIDFENMLQCRRNEPHRRRQIKRDLSTNVDNKKGIAGIRNPQNSMEEQDLASQMASINLDDAGATATNDDDTS